MQFQILYTGELLYHFKAAELCLGLFTLLHFYILVHCKERENCDRAEARKQLTSFLFDNICVALPAFSPSLVPKVILFLNVTQCLHLRAVYIHMYMHLGSIPARDPEFFSVSKCGSLIDCAFKFH